METKHSKVIELKKEITNNVIVNDDVICGLCDELIELAKEVQDTESIAYGYVWRADYFLYVDGNLKAVSIELEQAKNYLNEKQPTPLLEKYYTLRHVLNSALFDVQASFQYCLAALKVAEFLHLEERIGAHYGNIGTFFQDYESCVDALPYLTKALSVLKQVNEQCNSQKSLRIIRILLVNIIKAYLSLEDIESAYDIIQSLEQLPIEQENVFDLKIYVDTCYMNYYAALKDEEKTCYYVDEVWKDQLLQFPSRTYVIEFLKEMFDSLMLIENKQRAKLALTTLQNYLHEDELEPVLQLCRLNIRFSQQFETEEDLNQHYRVYYHLYQKMEQNLNGLKAEGLKTKVELSEAHIKKMQSQKRLEELQILVNCDELTKVYNRRYLNIKQTELLNQTRNIKIGFAIFDVDYFKEYNDYYGHLEGDKVLKQVANCLQRNADEHMLICRYGGDEFVCLSWDITEKQLGDYVQKIKSAMKKIHMLHCKSRCADYVTLSIGYGVRSFENKTEVFTLLEDVDDALYMAKKKGRNTIGSIQDVQGAKL